MIHNYVEYCEDFGSEQKYLLKQILELLLLEIGMHCHHQKLIVGNFEYSQTNGSFKVS